MIDENEPRWIEIPQQEPPFYPDPDDDFEDYYPPTPDDYPDDPTEYSAPPDSPRPSGNLPGLINGATILTTDFPDPVWIIPNLLPAGLAIFAGRPKVGKSWLALQISHSVSTGGMIFGHQVEKGRVLYLALEDNSRRVKNRMLSQNWTIPDSEDFYFMTLDEFLKCIGPLHKQGTRNLLFYIQAGGFRLVVIDTLSRALIGLKDINDSQQVTEALSPLQEMALNNDIGLLVIDHHTKPKGFDNNPIDDISGSTAKAAVADTLIGIYRDPELKKYRWMATGKDIDTVDLILSFDRLTGCWQSEGSTGDVVASQQQQEILTLLRQKNEKMKVKDIAAQTNQKVPHVSERLDWLLNKGLVMKEGTGKTTTYQAVDLTGKV